MVKPREKFKKKKLWEPFVISYQQNSNANPAQVGWIPFAKDFPE